MTFTDFRTTKAVPNTATTIPAQAQLACVAGDNFDLIVTLQNKDGTPTDCAGWVWAATASNHVLTVQFDTVAQPHGALLHLDGADTEQFPVDMRVPYDVAAFQPAQTYGRVVLAGAIAVTARVTSPTRPA